MARVLVGMPGYTGLTGAAAAGFYCCTADRSLARLRMQTGSLLAHNHNLLWCQALNGWKAGDLTHFACQHSDVEPQAGWLDVLLAEMEATGLDVIGVPVPLKDERGLTSTAVARDDGDRWRVWKRLSLTEIHALPETFTSKDAGGPLLLNTGLWACRLGDWSEHCWFTINDEIGQDDRGNYAAKVEPEDWFFSRRLHQLRVKVGCTRKVRLTHRGPMAFPNDAPWGQETDNAEGGS